jgi:hypothetical protein
VYHGTASMAERWADARLVAVAGLIGFASTVAFVLRKGGGPGCLRCRRRGQDGPRPEYSSGRCPSRWRALALGPRKPNTPASRWREGDAGFILALVGLSGALALAWAGLWLVIGRNIRTSMRYRAARRRPPPQGGRTPLGQGLSLGRGPHWVRHKF